MDAANDIGRFPGDGAGALGVGNPLHQAEGGCQVAAVEVAQDGLRMPELFLIGVVGIGPYDVGRCGPVAG